MAWACDANKRAHFGAQAYVKAVSSYPQVRAVTLTGMCRHI